jgi:transcriptional regulator with XRE-family HTH domain
LGNGVNEDPDQIIRDVGRRVAELRQALELTVSDCARRLGMTHQNLQRIERGEQNLTIRMMIRLATAPEVRPADLFTAPGSGHPRMRKGGRG